MSSARLKLDCKAVAAYRVAETKNETLALSNLAKKLLNAGFEPEARALCEQAQKMPNVNDAIAETLLSISQATEDEEKKQNQILKESKPVQDFFIQFGDAASLQLPKRAEGIWKGNRCALNFVVENGRLTANGEYTVKSGIGLINSIMAGPGGGGALEANPRRMIVKISGYTYGCAAICELSISEEGKRQPATLLGAASDKEKLLLALSSDCSNALAYEANAPESVQIYQLTHITAA